MAKIETVWADKYRFVNRVRGHEFVSDQPREAGGDDAGPSPTEFLVGSLSSCIGYFVSVFLERHDVPREGLAISIEPQYENNPRRIAKFDVLLILPKNVPEKYHEALLRVANTCTVHNTLLNPAQITLALQSAPISPAA